MFLLEWTASDLLLMVVGAAAVIGTILWLVPAAKVPHKRVYTDEEISAYDQQIPRYFLAAALALVIGSIHIIVKSLPGFWQWLWQAGYGGHLFRDLSNSHIIIVGGGTVLLTGITWYVLPRLVNRPLFSTTLASASFWFTLIGVFGFYLAWLILGLVEGRMVAQGMDYMAAKEALGAWHRVPTRITASIMGVGYWTYVLNVLLTVWVGRHVRRQPLGYLTKFAVVSAAALFVGTVQGVLQVLPANADWIHYAGHYGEFVDPISHAHINLVTGMMVSLAGFLIYFSPRLSGHQSSERTANYLFWTLVPGSLIFYLSFLILGLVLGGQVNGYGGIQSAELANFLGPNMRLILAVSGTLMLTGFWVYFIVLWRQLHLRSIVQQVREATPSAFWLVSSLALVVGTFQGILQVLPTTARILDMAEEVPNIHAQLNMIGGILLALMGAVYLLLPELLGQMAEDRWRKRSLWGVSSGIFAYYLTTLTLGLLRLRWLSHGLSDAEAAAKLGWAAPVSLLLTAVPLFLGFAFFGIAIYRTTSAYRSSMVSNARQMPARYSGPMPQRLKRIPLVALLAMEFIGGLFGWPGLGWLFAGQAMIAVGLLLAGPALAWALLPMLFSPFTDTVFSQWGWHVLLVWLPVSALVSSSALAIYLRRKYPREQKETAVKSAVRIPRGMLIGVGGILAVLLSIPLAPLVSGIPGQSGQQKIMADLPDRANGAYLTLSDGQQAGELKLFPWSFPVDDFPEESPIIGPTQVQGLTVRQKGLDLPQSYHLYHIEDESIHPVPLQSQEVAFQRQLSLIPTEPLEAGSYMLDIPTGGMFAGREYYYFRVDEAVTTLPPLAAAENDDANHGAATVPSSPLWLELLPLSAAIFSGLIVLLMLRRMRQKFRPQEAAWMVAFTMFALAAGIQVAGDIGEWTPTMARIYYICGATLVVGWLGLGTWLVLVHKSWLRNLGIWSMILVTGIGIGLISQTPVQLSELAETGWHALDKPALLTILTISLNSIGTLVLVGGALWSALFFWRKGIMKERMIGMILLAAGALAVAAGGSLTRLGHEQYLYLAMSIGVGLMFWGYLKTIRPAAAADASSPPVHSKQIEATAEVHAGI
ncbi:MAG: cbb3-type cytochrome c oxidase subunit I [Candidatus Promineifilaceae bacterium]